MSVFLFLLYSDMQMQSTSTPMNYWGPGLTSTYFMLRSNFGLQIISHLQLSHMKKQGLMWYSTSIWNNILPFIKTTNFKYFISILKRNINNFANPPAKELPQTVGFKYIYYVFVFALPFCIQDMGVGAFSFCLSSPCDNSNPSCWTLSLLCSKKIQFPLLPGIRTEGIANDWCIIHPTLLYTPDSMQHNLQIPEVITTYVWRKLDLLKIFHIHHMHAMFQVRVTPGLFCLFINKKNNPHIGNAPDKKG